MSEKEELKTRREKVAEEMAEALRKERAELKRAADALEGLVRHPGWKFYTTLIGQRANHDVETLQKPFTEDKDIFAAEYAKGTLNGLNIAVKLPWLKIEEAKQELGAGVPDDETEQGTES